MTAPSTPALAAIWQIGARRAVAIMFAPVFSSPESLAAAACAALLATTYAVPPPATMPSSTAARVALSASSMRSFFSFISVSVAAPTLMTATPPDSFARRSCSFSLSYSEVVVSIWARICAMRAWMSSLAPAPSTMVVVSFVTLT